MSAWMQGIGLGLEAARMRQQRDQFAQNQAFQQQQAEINNAQQDRAFAFQEQQAAFERQQREQQYKDKREALARSLAQDQADARIFSAAAQPPVSAMGPGMATGEGQQNYKPMPHALDSIDDSTLLNASPAARSVYLSQKQGGQAFTRQRAAAEMQLQAAMSDGSIRYLSPEQWQNWSELGITAQVPENMRPMSVKAREDEEKQQYAILLSHIRDPQTGDLVADKRTFEQAMQFPLKMLKDLGTQKIQTEKQMEMEQQKQAQKDREQNEAAAALQRLRTNTSQNRDRDFAIARAAGLVNQEAVNISGRESPESYKKTREYELARMDVDAAEAKVKATYGEDPEVMAEYDRAVERLRKVIRGGAPAAAEQPKPKDAIDEAIDQALRGTSP
ncbi:MAG: hypothetical protein EBR82_48770 [Caulobacteraceae bacterium]|nr:hypothetical protein [Caulobacteraceae bacterium]